MNDYEGLPDEDEFEDPLLPLQRRLLEEIDLKIIENIKAINDTNDYEGLPDEDEFEQPGTTAYTYSVRLAENARDPLRGIGGYEGLPDEDEFEDEDVLAWARLPENEQTKQYLLQRELVYRAFGVPKSVLKPNNTNIQRTPRRRQHRG